MLRFLLVIAIYAAIQLYFFSKTRRYIKEVFTGNIRNRINIAFIVFFIYINSLFGLTYLIPEDNPPLILQIFVDKPFWIWLISSIMLFLIFLAKDILVSVYRGIMKLVSVIKNQIKDDKQTELVEVDPVRRRMIKAASAGLALPPIGFTTYGVITGSQDILENRFEMQFRQLPENLRGLKIAHFTDIHSDEYTKKEQILKAVNIMNGEQPDLVLLTGDYVSHESKYIYPCLEALKEIRSKHGVFATMGNHDHWTDLPLIINEFEKNGIPVLHNSGRILTVNDTKIDLLGVDDSRWGRADINQALNSLNDPEVNGGGNGNPVLSTAEGGNFKLLLSHQPPYWDVARQHGIDLVLAGHTHGGQIALNVLGKEISLVDIFAKYVKGTFKEGDSQLYVSPGFGFTGPPFRLNNPPEVAIITLV